ncbi:YadA-like family protein [Haemophilus parainfluenzae]|uniref:YadA-like family protein n=1 Tax=Haemophilus parainfluenzae TaxID=729 RepID=UPI00066DBA53|nr:YadA-like family protein [Haemophilus parainfluenzae]
MNKIFKVIWCSSSQVWVAVSELSKVKPVSSVSSVKKTSSAVSTLLKTTALAIPFALSPLAAHAYVAIGSMNGGYASEYGANANPAGTYSAAGTRPLNYYNPGNKSYYDKDSTSSGVDPWGESLIIEANRLASPIAIGNHSNAMSSDGRASVAVGDYANASDGLGVAIGSYARSDRVGATAIGTASRAGGINSLAMMRQAAANGNYSVAIGSVSWAQGESSFAMGASATAKGDQSIAIGNVLQQSASASGTVKTKYNGLENTQSNGVRSVAIGSGAKTNGDDSFAFGSAASTGKFKVERDAYLKDDVTNPDAAGVANKAIAFGTTANATGNASIAFGANSLGAETNSIAFGVEAKARKADAIAFGSNANASEANAIAFGSNAEALHENVITIGKGSKATKKGAMTIGESAQSNANNSLALGNGTIINQADIKNKNAKYTNDGFDIENGVVAIANKGKERRLVNLAAGREDTDAVNVKQLSEVNDNLAKSIAGPNYNGYTVDGNGRYTYKAPDFEIKNQTLHTVKEAVELAQTNYVSVNADKTKQTDADSNYNNLGAKAAGSIALGEFTGTSATATDSIAIGHNTKVNGNKTVAIGANITAATNGSVILGDSSKADGSHATETVASKEIDGHTYNFAGKAKDAGRFVSVGEKGNERQIKNVAAGHVEADSTDAINGSQLYAVASRVEQGWKITAAQTGTGEVSGNAEKKVAMGDTVTFTAGNNIKITQNEKNLTVATKENVTFTNITTGNTSLDDKGLTIKNGPSVTKDGINAGDKKITNVSNGTISADSKDAVNGSQLHATNQNVTNNANNIANNAQNITKNAQNITKNAENIAKGLNFKGDNADVTVNRQLGETLNVTGGADKNNLSDNNIGVIGESNPSVATGGLAIKLAKDLKGLNSVETKQIKLGDNSSNTTIKYEGDRIKYGDKTVANLDDEKHITNTTYAVGNDGNVSLTYTDGKGNVVNGMTATITGVAKNDLSNINKAGETKIQNLAKDAIGMENGENTVASHRDVNGVKTFKVDVKGDLANITSITGGANTGKVEFAGEQVVNVAGDNPIKLDAKTGDITGLTNKTLDKADFGKKGRAATEEQLKIVNDSKIGDNNIRLAGNSGKTADQKLSKQDGIEFNVVGGDNAKYVTTTAAGANVTVDLTQDTKDKIDNAANKDLSNITNEGKKVITGLGTIVEAADSSVTVTNSTDAVGRTTYKVKANVPGANAFNIKYKANGANDQTVALTEGLDFTNGNFTTASVAANGVVKYDVKTGNITNGVDGKTGVNGNDGLATVKTVVEAINNSGWLANATKSTGKLDGTSTATKVKPGAVVNFDAGKNLTVKQQIDGDNHTYTYSLNKDIEVENVVVTGKDGKDGTIGLNGKDGTNGKNGTNRVDIQVEKGVDGVEGKNGADGISRVVYEDGKGKHTVATMEDGLKFKGDDSTVIAKKLNEQLDIIGGATKADLTDNNIGVNHDNGKLKVQLAKNLNLTDTGSIKFGDNNLNINKDGLTINNGPSVTKDGINAGNKAITNVKAGTNNTDAVNVSQLNEVKAAERHIKPGEYAVDNSGNVTMTYLDGNGQDVANENAVITGVAKNDLSNITDAGKKVITGLGSVVKAGQNVTVDTDTDATTGQKTYTVNAIAQNLGDAELAYKSNGDTATKNTVKVSDGLDFTNGNFTTASVGANGVVKYDVNIGEIEHGANGKDGKPGVKGNDGLATVKTVVEAINNSGWLANATKSAGELDGTSIATKVKPGAVVNFDAGKNLKVKQTINGDDHTYTYSLDSNLTNLDKVVVNGKDGANGKDGVTITGPNGTKGEDGKVGITGKDGKDAVSIAGKDGVGHIGLTGPKGADGSDGKSIDISTNDGTQTLVNQEPGTDKSQRIVYTPKDKDGNPIKGADGKDIVREIATMDDGLKFAGDDGQTDASKVIAKKLNQQVDIVGGADKAKLTENNIGVNNKDGKLNVQLSKDIDLTNDGSIKFGDNNLNINKDGLTINNGPSITKDGIDGGNKQIKNVQEGTDDNDVVTVKQLKGSKTIIENGKNTTVTGTGSTADPYKVNVEGALNDISSITNKDGNGKVEFAADQVVNVAGDNPIKLDAKTGDITSLTNKTIDGSDFATKGRAATEEQLKATGDQITNNLTKKGLNFGAQSGEVIHKNLGDQLDIVGEGTKADDRYDATNIKTMTKDGKVVVGLAKDLTADNVTVGQKGENGKDGVDGQIGVNGKDGSGVAINGKDGSIGLKGKDGENAVTIKTAEGPAGVNGKDGETKPRLVVNNEKVATLKDGLKFKGDKGDSIAKELNEELEILGKLDPNAAVTDKNLRVDNDAGKLVLKMAKQLKDLTSATFIDETTGNKSVIDGNGLTVKPKDADNTKTVSVTDKGLNNGGNQIVNVDSGLKDATGNKVALEDATGNTLNNAVNVGDLKDTIGNITNNGFGLTDENGNDVKAKLGETVTVKGDGSVTTKVITDKDGKAKLQVGLNKDVTIGNNEEPGTITVKGENGKDGISINGKDGTIGLKGEDGKDGIALNGKDGTIGINGKDGSNGKITVAQGKAGLDGNDGADGETKTRIVYEKPNGDKEEVATLNDGLKFTGNNEVVNSHKLNSLVTIKGEGVDKAASEAFKSAEGNVNVKADGKGTLEVQLSKDLKNIDSISNKGGQKIEFKDGGTTISGGNVSVGGNNITNVKAGKDDTDAVNVKQLKDGIAQATTKVAAGKNVTVEPKKNADGSTTYTVATKDDVDFTSVTTGKTTMNDGGITIKATEGGKTNVTLTNKGLDNGGNKVVNVAEGTNDTDAVNVKQLKAAKTEVEAGDNVVVTSTKGSNGQTIYKVNATDNSAHVDGSDAITVTKAPTTRKNGTTTVTDYKVDLSNKTKDDINKGVDAHDTVNNKGLTFNADKGTTGVKKLGSQVAVNGDNKNIETVADANGVKVKLKDDISVNTVTAKTIKAGDTTINDNGLTINNGPSVTKDGINAGGSRITNVAPGRDGTDAVNVNQLKKATNEINNSLNKMDKRRKAGTASALATAGLMQAYREGQSSVTAGVGQYQNQSAVAVGYSRLSDNGKYGVKVSFTTNTQGEVGGTASAGYFW